MKHLCESCEHSAAEHLNGGCTQQCVDQQWGDIYRCPCVKFERDPDE